MSTYVSKFYSRTVLETGNELEVHERIKELLSTCVDSSGKFNDPDFGPTESDPKGECSIFYPPDEQVDLQGDASVGVHNNIAGLGIDLLSWVRPRDFCKDPSKCNFITVSESESEGSEEEVPDDSPTKSARIVTEAELKDKSRGASSLDVMQGNLGDCWFISALALVAIRDDLFGIMVCEDKFPEYEKYGLFVFRMFRNCKVHHIIIDDKVPCMERSNGHCIPAFARCRNPDEFWVSLVEKAYAKLNIRYINLTSGFIDEALQDLSGLAPEMMRFSTETDHETFWQMFKTLSYTDSLMGASLNFLGRRDIPDEVKRELQTEAKHHGIQYGHAYGVLDVREVPDPSDPQTVYRFLRIKNPWGKKNNMEWNGDWCDTDPNWTDEMKEMYNKIGREHPTKFDLDEMEHKWGRNDNIFIMQFEDFLTYFNTLMNVRDFPDEWSGIRYFTAWSPSYGMPPKGKIWYKNPQFAFYVKKNTQISFRLQQPDVRSVAENRPPFKRFVILIVIFKIDPSETSVQEFDPKKIVLQSQGSDSRSVTITGDLKPGKYCAVLFNATEGGVCECYFSIYFNCTRDDIAFENKNWEVIKEEEEHDQEKAQVIAKALGQDVAAVNTVPGFQKIPEKTEEKKQEVKATVFGKTTVVQATQAEAKKNVTYSQAIKELKSNIEQAVPHDEPEKISDPLAEEIQFETEMAILFGMNYSDYRQFYAIPVEQQEKIIESYNVDKNRTATVLDLNYYGLGNKGLCAVFGGIEDFPNLEYLYLRGNKLGETSVCELCRRLELSRQLMIKQIDLSENKELGDTAGLALYALASAIKSIVNITLQDTAVTVKVLQKVNEQIERNKKLGVVVRK